MLGKKGLIIIGPWLVIKARDKCVRGLSQKSRLEVLIAGEKMCPR